MNPHLPATTAPVAAILRSKKRALEAVLPQGQALDRLQGAIMSACQGNARLVDAIAQNPDAAYLAIHKSVSWGLEIGHHAYLIPYKGEVSLVPSFLGLAELARRHPAVVTLNWHLIYKQEIESGAFSLDLAEERCKHEWNPLFTGSVEDIVGGYLIAQLATGTGTVGKVYHPVGKAVFEARCAEAKAKTPANRWARSPWKTNYPEMCMKTILRDAVNRGKIPQSAELRAVLSEPDTPAEREVVVEAVAEVKDEPAVVDMAETKVEVVDDKPHNVAGVGRIEDTGQQKTLASLRKGAEMLGYSDQDLLDQLSFQGLWSGDKLEECPQAKLEVLLGSLRAEAREKASEKREPIPGATSEVVVSTKKRTEKQKLLEQVRSAAEMLGWDEEQILAFTRTKREIPPNIKQVEQLRVFDLKALAPLIEDQLPGGADEADRLNAGHAS